MESNLAAVEISDECFKVKNLRVYCGTFNVNGKQPDEHLTSWLCLPNDKQQQPVDIYAIGFQELVDLTTTNLLLRDSGEREAAWIEAINAVLLNDKHFKSSVKYVLYEKLKMFGLFLFVYVNKRLVDKGALKEKLSASVATGLMDMLGNKGFIFLFF
jgi:hypothetical protein